METISKTSSSAFFSLAKHPVKFKLFLLKNLPAAYFAGLNVPSASGQKAIVTVPYKWFTRNPFRCTYFACLSMAAELSTGILAMANTYKKSPRVSLLVTGIEGKFYKKATGLTSFICEEGERIKQTVESAVSTGQPQEVKVLASGFNQQKELLAQFWVTWSFKMKQEG